MKDRRMMTGKRLAMITAMVFMLFLTIGTMTLYAAAPKTDAKKAIAGRVKTQYSKITKDAKKWGYTIARDKKEGKLKKSGTKAYSQAWDIRILSKKSKAFMVIKTNNTYSAATKKVSAKFTLTIYAEKYKGEKIGKTEKYNSAAALAKVMKQCRNTLGLALFASKDEKDTVNDGFQANGTFYYFYLTRNCPAYSTSYSKMFLHRYFCSQCKQFKMGGGTGTSILRTWNKSYRL